MIVVVFGPLLALWVFLIWRVRVEQGDVGIVWTPLRIAAARMRASLARMEYAMGVALLPPLRAAIEAMREWHKTVHRLGLAEALAAAERDRTRP